MTESRHYQRYAIPFTLTYAVDGSKVEYKSGLVYNVSEGGVLILVPENESYVRVDSILKISIEVAGRKFRLSGKVVRIEPKGLNQKELGISFIKVSDIFKMKMIEQVVKIEEYRLWKSKQVGYPVEEHDAAQEWINRFAKTFAEKA